MNETKQKILDVALDLFSQNGFSAVSIRDICKVVDIKESSVYYHFKNKQAILDELLQHFESIATGLMNQLEQALTITQKTIEENLFEQTCDCFFEKYLMDEYCNKIMRLLSIERLSNYEMQKIYNYWIKFSNKGIFSVNVNRNYQNSRQQISSGKILCTDLSFCAAVAFLRNIDR